MELQEIKSAFDINECYDRAWEILDDCEIYHQTTYGMTEIFNAWIEQKSLPVWNGKSLFEILAAHPNYVPNKGYIVFSNEYNRPLDFKVINEVLTEMKNQAIDILEEVFFPPYSYSELRNINNRLNSIIHIFIDSPVNKNITVKGRNLNYYKKEEERFNLLLDKYFTDNITFYESAKPFWKNEYDKICQFQVCIGRIKDWINTHKEDNALFVDEIFHNIVLSTTSIEIHLGTKVNKVIQRICRAYGIDKHPKYNSWIARLGDAISPIQFTRHTVISINPIDFWTMSYGTDWCSCANIDKEHIRSSSQEGMYGDGCCSSGTESYMLDPSTVVMYTVDSSYFGNNFELQDKVNRCLFHIGEGKFIMGRVYPQGTDGEDAVYKQWRETFQYVLATCMNIPNYWKTEKETELKARQHISTGTHYRDYDMSYCNVAGWSWNKPTQTSTYNPTKIRIGHSPICPCCGNSHDYQDAIECEDCYNDRKIITHCDGCNDPIYEDDNYIYCDDNGCCYCCENCANNDGVQYCTDNEWHNEYNCFVDSYNDEFYYIVDLEVETEDGNRYSSISNAEDDGYCEDEDGRWYPQSEFKEDAETGEWFHQDGNELLIDGNWFSCDENAIAYGYRQKDNGEWIMCDDEEEEIA